MLAEPGVLQRVYFTTKAVVVRRLLGRWVLDQGQPGPVDCIPDCFRSALEPDLLCQIVELSPALGRVVVARLHACSSLRDRRFAHWSFRLLIHVNIIPRFPGVSGRIFVLMQRSYDLR